MQSVEVVAIVLFVVGLVVAVASASRRYGGTHDTAVRVFIGTVLGMLGAIVILIPQIDVIPDGWQASLEPVLIGGITLVLLLGSVYRTAR